MAMPSQWAARVGDVTGHLQPLGGALGSPDVRIGSMAAWRGMSAALVAGLLATFKEGAEKIAEATAVAEAAKGTPGAGAAEANRVNAIKEAAEKMASKIMNSGADVHQCSVLTKVVVPDGPGVVITGSQTVLINGLPACRLGDTIQEASVPNTIAAGLPTVLIGD